MAADTKPMSNEPAAPGTPGRESEDSFEDPPLAEELPAVGPPMSSVCPASAFVPEAREVKPKLKSEGVSLPMQGGLSRERTASVNVSVGSGPGGSALPGPGATTPARMVRLCGPCAGFFEVGVGETYAMLQRKEGLHALVP